MDLGEALLSHGIGLDEAIDAIGDIQLPDSEMESVYLAARRMRLAQRLLGCLHRLVEQSSRDQIYKAFGAPGDWGYDTPLGSALYDLYRTEEAQLRPVACMCGSRDPYVEDSSSPWPYCPHCKAM